MGRNNTYINNPPRQVDVPVVSVAATDKEQPEFFSVLVTLTSAAASTPITILTDAQVGVGRVVKIRRYRLVVNGATAWTDATATDVRIRDKASSPVTLATILKAVLTGNAVLNEASASTTLAAGIITDSGATAGKGIEVFGTNGGTAANFAAGSDIKLLVEGWIVG